MSPNPSPTDFVEELLTPDKLYSLLTTAASSAGSAGAAAVFAALMQAVGVQTGVEGALAEINKALSNISSQLAGLKNVIADNENKERLNHFDNIAISLYAVITRFSNDYAKLLKLKESGDPQYDKECKKFCGHMQAAKVNGNSFCDEVYKLGVNIMTGSSGIGKGALDAFDQLAPTVVNWDIQAFNLKRNFRIYSQTLYIKGNAMAVLYLSHLDPENVFIADLDKQMSAIAAFFEKNKVTKRFDGKSHNYVVGKDFNLHDFFQCKRGSVNRLFCNDDFRRSYNRENTSRLDAPIYNTNNLAVLFAVNGFCGVHSGQNGFTYISAEHMVEMVRRANGRGNSLAQEFAEIGINVPVSRTNWLVFDKGCGYVLRDENSFRISSYDVHVNVVNIQTNVISEEPVYFHRAVYWLFKEWCTTHDEYVEDVFVFLLPDVDYWVGREDHGRHCINGFTSPDGDLYARQRIPINGRGGKAHNVLKW